MKKVHQFLLAFSLMGILASCNNELKITADWKEVTAIWGLLNKNDSVHYFRIAKGYLDPNTGAAVGAKIEDSLYYTNLQGRLEELTIQNGQWVKTGSYPLSEDRTIPKDPGFFGNKYQILYKVEHQLDATKRYRIVAVTSSGDEVSSETNVVNTFGLSEPGRYPGIIKMSKKSNPIKFVPPANARVHEMIARVHYTQYDPKNPVATNQFLFVDYYLYKNLFFTANSSGSISPSPFTYTMSGLDILAFLNQTLPKIDTINRQLKGIEFIANVGGEDLATYININQPSTSIVQDRPVFTNITSKNGNPTVGLFSSRMRIPANLKDTGIDANYYLSSPTFREVSNLDSLSKYPDLKFVW
jgi:hypothetical protein